MKITDKMHALLMELNRVQSPAGRTSMDCRPAEYQTALKLQQAGLAVVGPKGYKGFFDLALPKVKTMIEPKPAAVPFDNSKCPQPANGKCSDRDADQCCGGGMDFEHNRSVRCQCRICHPEVPPPVEAVFETTIRFYAKGINEESTEELRVWIADQLNAHLDALKLAAWKKYRKVEPDIFDGMKEVPKEEQ